MKLVQIRTQRVEVVLVESLISLVLEAVRVKYPLVDDGEKICEEG